MSELYNKVYNLFNQWLSTEEEDEEEFKEWLNEKFELSNGSVFIHCDETTTLLNVTSSSNAYYNSSYTLTGTSNLPSGKTITITDNNNNSYSITTTTNGDWSKTITTPSDNSGLNSVNYAITFNGDDSYTQTTVQFSLSLSCYPQATYLSGVQIDDGEYREVQLLNSNTDAPIPNQTIKVYFYPNGGLYTTLVTDNWGYIFIDDDPSISFRFVFEGTNCLVTSSLILEGV